MRWIRHAVFAVGLLCIPQGLVHVEGAPFRGYTPEEEFICSYSLVAGNFTAKRAAYTISGACVSNSQASSINIAIPWTMQGAYSEETGQVKEKVVMNGPSPWRGEIRLAMVCTTNLGATPFDPWLKDVNVIPLYCSQLQIEAKGEIAEFSSRGGVRADFVKLFLDRAQSRRGPVTTSFPYDRKPLLSKRQTDLQAEAALAAKAAAKAEKEKRLAEKKLQAVTQAPSPYRAALSPIVRSPVAGQRFLNQTAVLIKLGPPQGLTTGGYMVKIERKDPTGNWVAHTTLPVGAAQAESAAGYTGFGAGTPPGGITTPGAWRISAQVSSPKLSGWSEWVEFVVMAPVVVPGTSNNRLLQPPTKSFGK